LKSSLRLVLRIRRALTHKDAHKPQTFPADSSPSVTLRRLRVSAKKSFIQRSFGTVGHPPTRRDRGRRKAASLGFEPRLRAVMRGNERVRTSSLREVRTSPAYFEWCSTLFADVSPVSFEAAWRGREGSPAARLASPMSIRCACFSGGISCGDPFGNHSRFQVVIRTLAGN